MMKVILQEDVQHLGVVGDLVTVKDGFGRNYLIPQGKAVHASMRSVKELDHQKRIASYRRKQAGEKAAESKAQLQKLSITMQARVAPPTVNDDGKPVQERLQRLFGTITNRDLAKALADGGLKVDHRRISLADQVRTVGKYSAVVRLDGGVHADLSFWVIPEGAVDIEQEKIRVEAAQEASRREKAEAEAAAIAAAAAAIAAASEPANAAAEGEGYGNEDFDD